MTAALKPQSANAKSTKPLRKLQPVRGTHDALPESQAVRREIVGRAEAVCARYGYQPIEVPIFEFTEVFARTLGDSSDIVTKEMYSFEDRGGESLTLRPEFTAGIARAMISNGLSQHLPLKYTTHGPLFRYERPQKGRMRQFHQFDAECIGVADPLVDAEMIAMAYQVLEALGIVGVVELELNSLGDAESRHRYREALVAYFSKYKADLSEDSQRRLTTNPLRILDSKDEGDRKLVVDAPEMHEAFTEESTRYFDTLKEALGALNMEYTHNQRLVRGLDYYSHTVFEFTTDQLGAQSAVLSGGRYDGLIGMMGGPETPAIGWAAGIERLEALVEQLGTIQPATQMDVAVIPVGRDETLPAYRLAQQLRAEGVTLQFDYSGNMKKRLNRADKAGVTLAVLIGSDELARHAVTVRRMADGQQEEVAMDQLATYLNAQLSGDA